MEGTGKYPDKETKIVELMLSNDGIAYCLTDSGRTYRFRIDVDTHWKEIVLPIE
jgi:hypothetical protein